MKTEIRPTIKFSPSKARLSDKLGSSKNKSNKWATSCKRSSCPPTSKRESDPTPSIPPETTTTTPTNLCIMKQKPSNPFFFILDKRKNLPNKYKRSRSIVKILPKYRQPLRFSNSKNCFKYSAKTNRKTSKCLSLWTCSLTKSKSYSTKSVNCRNKSSPMTKSRRKRISKNT